MKLRNKETGEIVEIAMPIKNGDGWNISANSLAELNKDWEDYEESKGVNEIDVALDAIREYCNEHLCCSEDWEKIKILNTVEKKLKAWKRLKDKGFRFKTWYGGSKNIDYEITSLENETYIPRQICDDLDLLFGGKK